MSKYITEVLKELNDDPSLFQTTYRKIGNGGPLGQLFMHAFTAEGKFLLPEGEPPFRPAKEPMGMTPASFQREIRKFSIFCRKDLSSVKKETVFVQLLESLHPDEAKILIAVKDQKLTKLYPKLTRKVVAAAGFIPPSSDEEVRLEVAEVKKSEKRRGRSPKSASPQPTP